MSTGTILKFTQKVQKLRDASKNSDLVYFDDPFRLENRGYFLVPIEFSYMLIKWNISTYVITNISDYLKVKHRVKGQVNLAKN